MGSLMFLVVTTLTSATLTSCYLSTHLPAARRLPSHISLNSNWLRKLEEEKARRGLANMGAGGPAPTGNSSRVAGKYERAEDWDARGAGDVDLRWEERVKFDSRSGGDKNKQLDNLDKAIRGDNNN